MNLSRKPKVPQIQALAIQIGQSSNHLASELLLQVYGYNEKSQQNIIDNGLAFPIKHPDSWRAYPYHWAWLEQAQKPFSEDTIQLVLHKVYILTVKGCNMNLQISDLGFIEELVDELKEIFSLDKDYSERKFEKQMGVLRGQALNLASAMR